MPPIQVQQTYIEDQISEQNENLFQTIDEVGPNSDIRGNENQKTFNNHNGSVDNQHQNNNYFEKKLKERKKRTYNILKRFDPQLANEVIYKDIEKLRNQNLSQKPDQILKKFVLASIIIQKHFKGWKARQIYNQLLYVKYDQLQRQNEIENEKFIQKLMLEQETSRLQKEIEQKNMYLRYQIRKKDQAAFFIQRVFKSFLRRKQIKNVKPVDQLTMIENNYEKNQKSDQDQYSESEARKLELQNHQLHQEMKEFTQADISSCQKKKSDKGNNRKQFKQQHQSVGAPYTHRIGRGHLLNRIRQLQIETSNKSMIENHPNNNFDASQSIFRIKSPNNNSCLNNKLQGGSTTPIDLSNSQYLLNYKPLNNSFQGKICKTPQNLANLIRQSRLQQFNQTNNINGENNIKLDLSIGRRTGEAEELKNVISHLNKRMRLRQKQQIDQREQKNNNQIFSQQDQSSSAFMIEENQINTLLKPLSGPDDINNKTDKSLFSIGTSSNRKLLNDEINLPGGSGGFGGIAAFDNDSSPLQIQQNMLSSAGTSGLNQDSSNLDNSINNLFDSLKQPPRLFQNNFDLTQKLQEDFHQLISQCETIYDLDSTETPLTYLQEQNQAEFYDSNNDQANKNQSQIKNSSANNPKTTKRDDQVFNSKRSLDGPFDKNIYDKFLREETIKGQESIQFKDKKKMKMQQNQLMHKGQETNSNFQNASIIEIINHTSQQQMLMNDDTLSEDDLFQYYGVGLEDQKENQSLNKQLNENDFPMTQLIKERTIHYASHYEDIEQQFQYQQTSNNNNYNECNKNPQVQNQKDEQVLQEGDLNSRYSYFQNLIDTYNQKVSKLSGLQHKRDETVNKILFHQNILQNLSFMVKNVQGTKIQSPVIISQKIEAPVKKSKIKISNPQKVQNQDNSLNIKIINNMQRSQINKNQQQVADQFQNNKIIKKKIVSALKSQNQANNFNSNQQKSSPSALKSSARERRSSNKANFKEKKNSLKSSSTLRYSKNE